jgi:hypothetical protein
MTEPPAAPELGLAIARALGAYAVPYALGGALAYALYGNPRSTVDVDVNVFLEPKDLAPAFSAFRSLGIAVDEAKATAEAAAEGLFILWFEGIRIDVFTASMAFSWEAMRTRVAHHLDGDQVWFLSAEALAVFKLLFFRSKDLVDLERLVGVSGRSMDLQFVRTQVARMMGETDPRVGEWDRICRDYLPADPAKG